MSAASLLRADDGGEDIARLALFIDPIARACDAIFVGANLAIKAGPIAPARFTEWRINQNPYGMLLRFALVSNGTEIVLHLPGYLVSQIIDIGYGGRGQVGARSAFSVAETRFVQRVADQITQYIGRALNEPCQLAEMQSEILAFAWPKARDQIALASIFVQSPAIKSATISCFMDIATARRLARNLNQTPDIPAAANPEWRTKMQSAAMRVTMPVRAVLTRANLPAAQLLTLRPGDILPVLMPSQIPLTVAGRLFARGTIGEANGRAALKIEYMEGLDHE
jgi:flagellar motor switch protein FliM